MHVYKNMLDEQKLDSVIRQILNKLPDELKQARRDLEKNLKTAMHGTFAKMDLVTREEFDVQAELLSRTRAKLDELEQQLAALEQTQAGK